MSNELKTVDSRLTQILRARLAQGGPWPREVYRHVEREARARGLSQEAWLEGIESRAEDLAALISAATVGHTSFFRHPDHFARLKSAAERIANRTASIKVWSAACSTGEEAWSIALCLKETGLPFQVWSSDVNGRAVEAARTGLYPARATTGLSGYEGKLAFHAPAELKSAMRFWTAAITDPLPADAPTQFDFIFCRNVMIYFQPDVIERTWRVLLQRLAPWGAIAVAPVESLSHVPSEIERTGTLGWMEWRGQATRLLPAIPEAPKSADRSSPERSKNDLVDRALERVARLLAASELDEAEQELHRLLSLRDDAFGWFLLGETCARRGETTQARIAYERASRAQCVPADVDLTTMRDAAARRARQLDGG